MMADKAMQQQPTLSVRYLAQQQIDTQKWNDCLAKADNPFIYATSIYLNAMCKQWDALVWNDYEAIMPLPWNRKYGICYLYSPYYVIAGGVFGRNITGEMLGKFMKAIPKKFWYWELDLNEQNFFPDALQIHTIDYGVRTNTLLNLSLSYQQIFTNYSTLAKRKIKKAGKHNLQLKRSASVKEIINLYQKYYKEKDTVFSRYDFGNMIMLLQNELASHVKTYVLSFNNGEVCAFYLLLFDDHYVYWLIGGSTEKGKEAGAFYYLTNTVIQDFAGTNRTFRFEGSDVPGIAFFNRQFGGTVVHYPKLTVNKLPWPLRYFKHF